MIIVLNTMHTMIGRLFRPLDICIRINIDIKAIESLNSPNLYESFFLEHMISPIVFAIDFIMTDHPKALSPTTLKRNRHEMICRASPIAFATNGAYLFFSMIFVL